MSMREDTFDILEDQWDFADGEEGEDGEEELWVGEGGEGLGGDEPPRSLDAMAAISQVRPPKRAFLSLPSLQLSLRVLTQMLEQLPQSLAITPSSASSTKNPTPTPNPPHRTPSNSPQETRSTPSGLLSLFLPSRKTTGLRIWEAVGEDSVALALGLVVRAQELGTEVPVDLGERASEGRALEERRSARRRIL